MMKRMTVEQALIWAYRDQMVHVAVREGVPVEMSRGYSPGLSEASFLADKIDSGVSIGFAAAPDAYAIHAQVQMLEPVTVRRSADEIEMLYARRLLKNDFDSMDHRGTGDAARPDATVKLLPRSIVQESALAATRPDRADEPCVIYEKGLRVYTDRQGRIVTHHTRFGFTMLNVVGDDPLETVALRRRYSVWRQALIDLRESLPTRLRAINILPDLPPAALAVDFR